MEFTDQERLDIRELLVVKVGQLDDHLGVLEETIARLERGEEVFPFARGPEGVRTATEIRAGVHARRDRLRLLAERFEGDEE